MIVAFVFMIISIIDLVILITDTGFFAFVQRLKDVISAVDFGASVWGRFAESQSMLSTLPSSLFGKYVSCSRGSLLFIVLGFFVDFVWWSGPIQMEGR